MVLISAGIAFCIAGNMLTTMNVRLQQHPHLVFLLFMLLPHLPAVSFSTPLVLHPCPVFPLFALPPNLHLFLFSTPFLLHPHQMFLLTRHPHLSSHQHPTFLHQIFLPVVIDVLHVRGWFTSKQAGACHQPQLQGRSLFLLLKSLPSILNLLRSTKHQPWL